MDEIVTNLEAIKQEKSKITPDKLSKDLSVFGITGTIDLTNLLPENIKAGVTINGVTGTYTGETTE